MEARKVRSAAEARWCLAEAEKDARPRAVWAREHGVCARSLNAWRINLERPERRSGLRLVELVAAPPATPVYRIRCGGFEVVTAGDFDEASLGRLLRVVASC